MQAQISPLILNDRDQADRRSFSPQDSTTQRNRYKTCFASLLHLALGPGELLDLPLTLTARPEDLTAPNFELTFRACHETTGRCRETTTRYLGPTP